jgi:alkylation response protein AidB-like acyl-CoA dehydrogenase
MSATMTPSTPILSAAQRRTELVTWAARLGPDLAARAVRFDADGTWVGESYDQLVAAGALALAVPEELGGRGATAGDLAAVMRELARHCGSTALAMAMHQHAVLFHAWRYRRQQPGADDLLRRVVSDDVVLATAGGSDFTHPTGSAARVEGGYRVSGRKRFVSQSKAASVLSALFPLGADGDRRIIGVTVPLDAPGVTVLDTWNTLGMRGTASNDVALDDVFVPDELVGPTRPYGVIDPPLQIIGTFAAPIISAVYLGVAESAYREALAKVAPNADVLTQRAIGAMAVSLRVAAWALDGALAAVGDDPEPSMETFAAVLAAKHEVARAGIEVCDTAMEVAGGAAFCKGSTIERAYRDIRAVKFHPLTPELTLVHAGRHALGIGADVV